MDGEVFDALARQAGRDSSRRGALRAGIGTIVAVALGLCGLRAGEEAAARKPSKRKHRARRAKRAGERSNRVQAEKKKGKKKACPPCKKRKKGKCKGTLPDGAACPGGTCHGGSCVSASPTCTCQGKTCGDDGCGGNCGTCGGDFRCESGSCVLDCGNGLSECDDACLDLQTDPANCGTCGHDCGAGRGCEAGDCVCDPTACTASGGCCEGQSCEPTNTQTDPENCGACGTICEFAHASARCEGGTCQLGTCDAGYANCDEQPGNGCDTNTQNDVDNCGACGTVCSFPNASAQCESGACVLGACDPGFANCDGQTANGCETVIESDPAHCGDCGTKCHFAHASATCEEGTCQLGACDAGYANCDGEAGNGCEAHLSDDLDHCGECGHPCNRDTQICDGGGCVGCDVCASGCLYDSIQDAIDEAESGETIRVCAGNWVVSSTILVTKSLTIIGAGAGETVLDGDHAVRVLQTLNGTIVTLRNLTITRGGEIEGAGILNPGFTNFDPPQLTLIGVHVTGNKGGGIANGTGASLTLKAGTIVSGNTGHGGIANTEGTLILDEGSRVENNTTPEEGGGIDNRFGTVTLKSGSRVVGNTAVAFDGGGISNQSGVVTLEAGSLVKGNTARYGGGISTQGGTITLQAGSRVEGNTSTSFAGGGIIIHNVETTTISIAEDTIVTDNEPDNCAPVDTILNCIG